MRGMGDSQGLHVGEEGVPLGWEIGVEKAILGSGGLRMCE